MVYGRTVYISVSQSRGCKMLSHQKEVIRSNLRKERTLEVMHLAPSPVLPAGSFSQNPQQLHLVLLEAWHW